MYADDDNDEVSVELTGDGCVHSGPTEFEVGPEFEITVSDVTEERMDVGFAVWKVPDGTSVAEVREPGIFEVAEGDAETPVNSEVTKESTERVMSAALDVAGMWIDGADTADPSAAPIKSCRSEQSSDVGPMLSVGVPKPGSGHAPILGESHESRDVRPWDRRHVGATLRIDGRSCPATARSG